MRLIDKYRPQTLTEIIGQDKAVSAVKRIIARPTFDRGAFWVSGPSGTGKTSLALALARELRTSPVDIIQLDGDSCSVDAVRELKRMTCFYPLSGCRVIIINEAHAITPRAIQGLLTLLDDIPPHNVLVFTTTETGDLFGNFSAPLASRCTQIAFTSYGVQTAFAEHAKRIGELEGINGRPLEYYARLVKEHKGNLRAVLQTIEGGD